jgi:hypothetical protein
MTLDAAITASPAEPEEPAGAEEILEQVARRARVTVDESWAALLAEQKDFQVCQKAVAHVTPRDENDLALKAAVAFTHDNEKGAYGSGVALISYSVAFDLWRMRQRAMLIRCQKSSESVRGRSTLPCPS